MGVLLKNNAGTLLSADVNTSTTSISVASSASFPTPSGSDYFYATMDDGANVEIVKVTGISGTTLTVVRAQDNTSARSFSTGDKLQLRVNVKALEELTNLVDATDSVKGIASFDSNDFSVSSGAVSLATTSTAAELNILDGVTSTTAELNILDGVTSTTAELNVLDGVTSTTAELNILDGVTATTAEINHVDGVTSNVQTQLDAKQPLDAELTELATMASDTASSLADLTAAEVQTLDGVTSSTAELNILDGVTSTTAELNILDGVTSTAAELNILDGVTSTAAELNILDGVTSTAAELNILDGVTSTAAELNVIDGDTSATSTTLADADRVVVNDAGTMKQVALTDFDTRDFEIVTSAPTDGSGKKIGFVWYVVS